MYLVVIVIFSTSALVEDELEHRNKETNGVGNIKDLHSIQEVKHFVNDHQLSFIYVLKQS